MKKSRTIFLIAVVCLLFAVSCNDGPEGLFLSAVESVESSGAKIFSILSVTSTDCWLLTDEGILRIENIGTEEMEADLVIPKSNSKQEKISFQYASIVGDYIYILVNSPSDPDLNGKLVKYTKGPNPEKKATSEVKFSKLTDNGFAVSYNSTSRTNILSCISPTDADTIEIKEIGQISDVVLTSDDYALVRTTGTSLNIYKNDGNLILSNIPNANYVGFQTIGENSFMLLSSDKKVSKVTSSEIKIGTVSDDISTRINASSFYDETSRAVVFKTYNGFTIVDAASETPVEIILAQNGFAAAIRNAGEISGIRKVEAGKYIVSTVSSGLFEISNMDKFSKTSPTDTLKLTDSVNVYR